ncbi:response regulator transcription factor [Variovorax boronicumulans]|uniref:response regulator transcription factor n=1 Tax=Variovorax boronicumulans TaxID=436515 RepID=UPI001F0AFF5F|nr:response regulator [Variovorax boronicumulans]
MRTNLFASSNKLSVYLVEDENDIREALVYSLNQMNFVVTGFADATSFYRAFAVARCDIAVLDVGLPGEDGFTIAGHLRSASNVGIVLATARAGSSDRIQGMRAGADAYLVKPMHPEELAATLEAVGRRLSPPRHRGRPPRQCIRPSSVENGISPRAIGCFAILRARCFGSRPLKELL